MSKRSFNETVIVRKNKGVDGKLVRSANKAAGELRALGIKTSGQYRIVHPFDGTVVRKGRIRSQSANHVAPKS